MAEATALFGMPGSTVLAAARVAGEREVLIETAQECQARRRGGGFRGNNGGVRATSEGICAGHGLAPVWRRHCERPRLCQKAPRKPAK